MVSWYPSILEVTKVSWYPSMYTGGYQGIMVSIYTGDYQGILVSIYTGGYQSIQVSIHLLEVSRVSWSQARLEVTWVKFSGMLVSCQTGGYLFQIVWYLGLQLDWRLPVLDCLVSWSPSRLELRFHKLLLRDNWKAETQIFLKYEL